MIKIHGSQGPAASVPGYSMKDNRNLLRVSYWVAAIADFIIADRKPIERRWVLLPTMLVVFLLGVAGIYAASVGATPFGRIVGSSTAVVVVLGLLTFTWFKTGAQTDKS